MQSTTGAGLPWALYLQLLLTPVGSTRFAQTGTASPVLTKTRANRYERVSFLILSFFQVLAIHRVWLRSPCWLAAVLRAELECSIKGR